MIRIASCDRGGQMEMAEPVVERVAQGMNTVQYHVASRTRSGVWHEVTLATDWPLGSHRCSCEAGQHGQTCWAVRLAQRLEDERHA
jgi:hypothetical protein